MGRDMLKPGAVARQHFGIEEGLQLQAPLLRPAGQFEIHAASRDFIPEHKTHIDTKGKFVSIY
jgi:hypothetical protein